MMGMALNGKWSSPPSQFESTQTQPHVLETVEAEVVEPTEAGSQKWEDCNIEFFVFISFSSCKIKNIGVGILFYTYV